ncbi:MAG: hypothetical protein F6J97_22470 [Leptolyngbya sp. SIO4C1]|nr:hypothetical protein [Leptolyngbya sp. SIO4C1]
MKLSPFKIGLFSTSLLIGATAPGIAADFTRISSAEDFYTYYGNDFSAEAKAFVEDLYSYLTPYFGPNGRAQAAADGFVPMTPEAKFHGTHWFKPEQVYNFVAEPTRPAGLNFDQENKLVAVYWGETKYDAIEQAVQSFSTLPPENLPALYTAYKEANVRSLPTILAPFGDLAAWHSHENVVIENVGAIDPSTGFYDAEAINFRQSLLDEAFIAEIFAALQDPQKVAAPFEVNPDTYPPFNLGIHPGFYMAHLWIGAGNPDGPFNTTHAAVSPNGLRRAHHV